MVEHQEEILPQNVAAAKEILIRLGDFTYLKENDNVMTNILAAAELFAVDGKLSSILRHLSDDMNLSLKVHLEKIWKLSRIYLQKLCPP
jgi:hypothetical protein